MEKLPKVIYQLAGAILVLALSVSFSATILLATMPQIKEIQHQLMVINPYWFQDSFKMVIFVSIVIFVIKSLLKKKEPSNSPKKRDSFPESY